MSYFNLGQYSFPITTNSDDAQLWFDRGLMWIYGYNHEEAIFCFDKAIEADKNCAMAYWGVSYAVGPNYNKKWVDFSEDDKSNCVQRSMESLDIATSISNLTPVEQDLIEALLHRYPKDSKLDDFSDYNDAYANKMRTIYHIHETNLEVSALFAEALMNRTPWQLWEVKTGLEQKGASTLEAISVLETAFSKLDYKGANNHPGLLHMYIHLMEMSPHPEKALKAGDALTNLVPDAGHLQHMATHIDVLCGHYENVVRRNHIASLADKKYLDYRGSNTFYTAYVCHNLHFKIYGAMFLGQIKPALEAADELKSLLTEEVVRPSADWLESYYPMKLHVLVRFGKWEEIISHEFPKDRDLYCFTTALIYYAKTIAFAATNLINEAEQHKKLFFCSIKSVPETRVLFNNLCIDILAVAGEMLEGEIAYRKQEYTKSFQHLRKAVYLDDVLPYEEPWGWMQPARHALGALLLEQGEVKEAEEVYRADLGIDEKLGRPCQNPDNVWSLHGLYECLKRRGADTEAIFIKQRLDLANARADSPILASCFCRLTHQKLQL